MERSKVKSILNCSRAVIVFWIAIAGIFLSIWGPAQLLRAQQGSGALEALQIRPNFYMLAGAGGNIGVQIGPDGVVLVDAGTVEGADRVSAAIEETDRPADPVHHQHGRGRRSCRRERQTFKSRPKHLRNWDRSDRRRIRESHDQQLCRDDSRFGKRAAPDERADRKGGALSRTKLGRRNVH